LWLAAAAATAAAAAAAAAAGDRHLVRDVFCSLCTQPLRVTSPFYGAGTKSATPRFAAYRRRNQTVHVPLFLPPTPQLHLIIALLHSRVRRCPQCPSPKKYQTQS
jgi:hypothetical protein